jgi:hypothetical protein
LVTGKVGDKGSAPWVIAIATFNKLASWGAVTACLFADVAARFQSKFIDQIHFVLARRILVLNHFVTLEVVRIARDDLCESGGVHHSDGAYTQGESTGE